MAETLGSLCDKLTIVKLKQWHSENEDQLTSLANQESQIKNEIDEFTSAAINGNIPFNKLTFSANKVYKTEGNDTKVIDGNIGEVFSMLATINCKLWHEQEKVYAFSKIPVEQKDMVIHELALLNLERNKCIDQIDKKLCDVVEKIRTKE